MLAKKYARISYVPSNRASSHVRRMREGEKQDSTGPQITPSQLLRLSDSDQFYLLNEFTLFKPLLLRAGDFFHFYNR